MFFGMLTRPVYICRPQKQSRAASLGGEAVVVAAKARRFHPVVVWPSMKGKTDEEWTDGLNGNEFPNYRSGPSKEHPHHHHHRQLATKAVSKISRCLWTQKQADQDEGHPEIRDLSRAQHRCSAAMSRARKTQFA